jgi:hypothetical protein
MYELENNKPILSYGNIRHNILFAMNAMDVITAYEDTSLINVKTLLTLYFPYLYEKDIYDKSTLDKQQLTLRRNTSRHLSEGFHNRNHVIDTFYKIHRHLKSEPHGYIRVMTITITQKSTMSVPLDYLFNLIPTSKDIPMSRYHEDIGYMKLYRI